MISRREMLLRTLAAGLATVTNPAAAQTAPKTSPKAAADAAGARIDRRAVVSRHNVVRTRSSPVSPLQVGNGGFAFGADITGLQTFVSFNTMSDWGWHEFPLPAGQTPADFQPQPWDAHGRPVLYWTEDPNHPDISRWLFLNPFRLNLGRIGLRLTKSDGTDATEADLTDCRQELDLWNGILTSRFVLDGQKVMVETACHPEQDLIAVRVRSPLLSSSHASAYIDFPNADAHDFANYVGDWDSPDQHKTPWQASKDHAEITHRMDGQQYHVRLRWQKEAVFHGAGLAETAPALAILQAQYGANGHFADVAALVAAAVHDGRVILPINNQSMGGDPALKQVKTLDVTYTLGGVQQHAHVEENDTLHLGPPSTAHRFSLDTRGEELAFVCAFALNLLPQDLPNPEETFAACRRAWPQFWQSGAAIDLSESRDSRWTELERRVVLSQYLMRVNEAGQFPPQESGLVNNGWSGKFHMEMYFWHGAHWALWNRWPELERSLGIYTHFLPSSLARAKQQGYQGARWPKMTCPDGHDSPNVINPLLIWEQPHPIFFAELDYRAHPTRETLEKWREVLFETAAFMGSYPFWDSAAKRSVLGPPLFIVSENTNPHVTINPTFELSQWRFGLRIAQLWRERLGLPRDPQWDRVLHSLAPLPVQDGVYVTYEGIPEMWTHFNFEHPGLIGAYGMLPGDGVDVPTMQATADRVRQTWNLDRTWGWDFPMLAMNAARLGNPAQAVEYLLHPGPQFNFDDAGLATGGPFPYFPSNGGLLYAIALMAAGWDGSPDRAAPGFPADGSWAVKSEGLARAI